MDPSAGRFAIADGAATSARPEVWSRVLVQAFVGERIDPLAPPVLTRLRDCWSAAVRRPGLPWYAEAKLCEGASSTFLGLHVDPGTGRYRASAVGDSCLFHVRNSDLLMVGAVTRSAHFRRFTELVSSRPDVPVVEVAVLSGIYRSGDVFLLATDALAKFLLAVHERYGRLPTQPFAGGRERFQRSVAGYRRRGHLDNDDTTLCLIRT